ncbi:MAG: 23S rRNA (adenine(2503)-C(2))-methyltransferase RlmN [Gemmatimonadota bacterium]|nr:23S rRNA (adenine(2503)-C(2))-methyltransferase RlmN [Gemmatimonadota bacterium]MDH3421440.1 23S rRNA (adenine(2503)-C(2))-methyltransferase RlmN [Gemmatimonadota bacterium]
MPDTSRHDLLSLPPDALRAELARHFQSRGQPSYRAGQVERWIFEALAPSPAEMTDLPGVERDAIAENFSFAEASEANVARSADGTVKHVWRLVDGELVESVLIPRGERLTLCLSSQAGCAMGCTFCATGWGGFDRQLSAGEIVTQYRASRRWAEANGYGPITNIVYMGMGEPLANRAAVHASLTLLNQGYAVGARRITVSTVGVVPGILELAARPEQFRLALSLHAPVSHLRRELIPLEKRYPLPDVLDALRAFDEAGGKRITFEYTMIDGINDALELIGPLAELSLPVRAFVNLIPYNPIPYQDWRPSPAGRIRAFAEGLERRGVAVAVRETRGRDIDAACGQLRAHTLVQLEKSPAET